jgi:hypothetical protein
VDLRFRHNGSVAERSYRGGMSLAVSGHRFKRFNATMPLAILRFSESGVWLGTSPLAVPPDCRSVSYERDEIRQVFRAVGWFGFGVGLDTVDVRPTTSGRSSVEQSSMN